MTQKNIWVLLGIVVVFAAAGYLLFADTGTRAPLTSDFDATPQTMTLHGTYECLPHLDTTGPQTDECAFGLVTDDGVHYAVNFGASANSMEQFQMGAHITAEGFVVIKEALSTDQWQKYNMRGIFTITRMIESSYSNPHTQPSAKINIDAVCEGALAYMTFPDGESSAQFVAECKEGQHPEVIEQYKAQMGLGDGAAI